MKTQNRTKTYAIPTYSRTSMLINKTKEGETLETKIERMINNKEPIKENQKAPLLFTERKEGVRASTNIRTDRWEIAVDATSKVEKSYKARREERHKPKVDPNKPIDTEGSKIGGPEPTQGK